MKRPYFHVKPLERAQLKNWHEYLEFMKVRFYHIYENLAVVVGLGVKYAEVGTRKFFPGSLIAKSLFVTHGSLSLKRYFLGLQGSLIAKSLIKKTVVHYR